MQIAIFSSYLENGLVIPRSKLFVYLYAEDLIVKISSSNKQSLVFHMDLGELIMRSKMYFIILLTITFFPSQLQSFSSWGRARGSLPVIFPKPRENYLHVLSSAECQLKCSVPHNGKGMGCRRKRGFHLPAFQIPSWTRMVQISERTIPFSHWTKSPVPMDQSSLLNFQNSTLLPKWFGGSRRQYKTYKNSISNNISYIGNSRFY